MKKQLPNKFVTFLPIAISFSFFSAANAQAPLIEWQKSLGGSGNDWAYSIQQTADGGFIVGGWSDSNDGDISGWHTGYDSYGYPIEDYTIIKLDSIGNISWQKSLGGSDADQAFSIQQTTDGGYIVGGMSSSNDGDASGNHSGYDYYGNPVTTKDFWITKLDGNGNLLWQKSLGGSGSDIAFSVQQIADGGFVAVGSSFSNDGDVSGNHGSVDEWIVKLDTSGDLVWQKSLGGSRSEGASSIQQTADGGFILAGGSDSNDGDVSGNHGDVDYFGDSVTTSDAWIVKLDESGDLEWQKSLGGSDSEGAWSIQQTNDSGYIFTGISNSNDGDVSGNHGGDDGWVVKLDILGNIVWQKSLGGNDQDNLFSIQQTSDSGFVVAGLTRSNNDDVSGLHGFNDDWVVKLDASGNLLWQKCLGGSYYDNAYSIDQTSDEGFIVAGYSTCTDGDVSGNHGAMDYWIIKLSSDLATSVKSLQTNLISLYPNPASDKITLSFPTNENRELQITDILGQIIYWKKINSFIEKIDVSTFPTGIYLITSATPDQKFQSSFLKQ